MSAMDGHDRATQSANLVRGALRSFAAVVMVALVGCGVPIDSSPRAITRTTLDPDVYEQRETPTTVASPGARQVSAYFMRDETLERVRLPVERQLDLAEVLAFTTGEAPDGLSTKVPTGTGVLSAEIDGSVATIDLTTEINDIGGPDQKQAYAQLVFTALAYANIAEVRFMVEGKPVDAPTDNGNRASITENDYDDLHPEQ